MTPEVAARGFMVLVQASLCPLCLDDPEAEDTLPNFDPNWPATTAGAEKQD